jgi:hypothetical protein
MQLVVGVTGHRWNKIAPDAITRVRRDLASVFANVDRAIAAHQGASVLLISCLAEGADQLAVRERPAGWAFEAMLPFPRARYMDDFAPPLATGGVDRRGELTAALAAADTISEPPDILAPEAAYDAAAARMLARSDILVAVWNGQPAAGRGGTETVVAKAMQAGLATIWIQSAQQVAPSLLSTRETPRTLTADLVADIVAARLAPRPRM